MRRPARFRYSGVSEASQVATKSGVASMIATSRAIASSVRTRSVTSR